MNPVASSLAIARNAAALIFAELIVRGFSTIGAILVARSLGPASYGRLSVALAFTAITAYFADIGLTDLTFRQLAQPKVDIGNVLGTVLRARLLLALAVVICTLFMVQVVYHDPSQRALILLVVIPSVYGLTLQGFASGYFLAMRQMHITALLRMSGQVLTTATLIVACLCRSTVDVVGSVYGITSLLGGMLCFAWLRRCVPAMKGWSPRMLKGISAFTIGGLTSIILPQLGVLVLERVTSSRELGYFSAASRIPTVLYAIPACVAMAWYPELFSVGIRDPARHLQLCISQFKINGLIGMGLSLPVAMYSKLLISTVLGAPWADRTAPVLSILCWMVVLNSVTTPLADFLTTTGRQARRATVYCVAVVVGALLFAQLGATAGALGASLAAVITQLILSIALVLVNGSGINLAAAGLRALAGPGAFAALAAVIVRLCLPVNYLSAFISSIAFFFLVCMRDADLNSGIRSVAARAKSEICRRKFADTTVNP